MKNKYKILAVGAAVASALATASAVTVTWNVATSGLIKIGAGADEVQADAGSGAIDLVLGANTVAPFNNFDYAIGSSATLAGPYSFDVSRSLMLNGVTQTLNQTGTDTYKSSPGSDTITVNLGSTSAAYDIGGGYVVLVSVAGDSFTGIIPDPSTGTPGQTQTDTVDATFTLEYVPDGGLTAGLLSSALIGLATLRRKLLA